MGAWDSKKLWGLGEECGGLDQVLGRTVGFRVCVVGERTAVLMDWVPLVSMRRIKEKTLSGGSGHLGSATC